MERKRLSTTKKNRIIKMAERGIKQSNIAEKLGVPRGSVYFHAKKAFGGKKEKPVEVTAKPQQLGEVQRLRQENMKLKAEIYDLLKG